jgi:hypothetical protein
LKVKQRAASIIKLAGSFCARLWFSAVLLAFLDFGRRAARIPLQGGFFVHDPSPPGKANWVSLPLSVSAVFFRLRRADNGD